VIFTRRVIPTLGAVLTILLLLLARVAYHCYDHTHVRPLIITNTGKDEYWLYVAGPQPWYDFSRDDDHPPNNGRTLAGAEAALRRTRHETVQIIFWDNDDQRVIKDLPIRWDSTWATVSVDEHGNITVDQG
jgi:hypothetical protein